MPGVILWVLTMCVVGVSPADAGSGALVAQQIGAADAGLLFGGADAEGGIGDWYVSNGVVEAIIDDAGPVPDLLGIVPPADVPPINSSAAVLYDTVTAPSPGVVRGDVVATLPNPAAEVSHP
jgi:hypothetical protein